MTNPDLGYALNLPPHRAVDYFRSKKLKITWDWWDSWREAQARAFTVAKVARMDILQDIRDMVLKALETGMPFGEFKKQLEPLLRAKGWWGYKEVVGPDGTIKRVLEGSPWRLKTIYRTNLQSAYMAGRYKALMEGAKRRPWWMYVAVLDSRTRPAHRALHGKVFRFDDPFWNHFYPPLGFNCRCRVRALSTKDLIRRGITPEVSSGKLTTSRKLLSKKTGIEKEVTGYRDPVTGEVIFADPGWDYNPGKAAFEPELGKYHPDIRKLFFTQKPGFAKRFPVKSQKDIPEFLRALGKEHPELFRYGLGSIEFKRVERWTMAAVAAPRYPNHILISTAGHRLPDPLTGEIITYNPAKELASALKKLSQGKPLTYTEEYAVKNLWHELTHTRSRGGGVSGIGLQVMETLNQFVARHTYDEFMSILGGEVRFKKTVLDEGWGYYWHEKNFRYLLSFLGIPEDKALSTLRPLLFDTPYSELMEKAAEALANLSGKEEQKFIKVFQSIDQPVDIFKARLQEIFSRD